MNLINSEISQSKLVIFIVFFSLIFSLAVNGQNPEKQRKADSIFAEARKLARHFSAKSKKLSLVKFEEARKIYNEIGNKKREASCFNWLAGVSNLLGEKRKALEYRLQALSILKTINAKSTESATLYNVGKLYYSLGETDKALDYYRQALLIDKNLGDRKGQATILVAIGFTYNSLGDKQTALEYYRQSLSIYRAVGSIGSEANVLNNIGLVYHSLKKNREALSYYNKSLSLYKSIRNKRGEANTLNNIGIVYNSLNDRKKALEYLNQALLIRKRIGDLGGEGEILTNIGSIYSDLNLTSKALEFQKRALQIFKEIGHKVSEAITLRQLGSIYFSMDEKDIALNYLKQSLQLNKIIGNKPEEAGTLANLGKVYFLLNNKQKALEYFNEAILIHKKIGDKTNEAVLLNNIGVVNESLGKRKKALEYFRKSLQLSSAVGSKSEEARTLNNMMSSWQSLQKPRVAIFYGSQAVKKMQNLRDYSKGLDSVSQKSLLRGFRDNYKKFAELLIAEGKLEQAIQVLTLYQNQQFFDFNQDINSNVQKLNLSPRQQKFENRYDVSGEKILQINQQIEGLQQKINNREPNKAESTQLKNLKSKLKIANGDLLKLFAEIEKEFSKKTDVQDSVPPIKEVLEMKKTLKDLHKSTNQKPAILYTLIGENSFHILLVNSDKKIKHFKSDIKKDDLNEKIKSFYALLQSPVYDPNIVGKELYDLILKPVETELRKQKTKTLMWWLDGNLRYIPTAALFDGNKYLAEKYQNVVFTRADTERLIKDVKKNWTGTGFGSSEAHTIRLFDTIESFSALPGVTEELNSIFQVNEKDKGILDGEVISDKEFTKQKFYKVLKKKRPVIHISSHFSFRPGDDSRSYLLLGDGNALTLNEMKNQKNLFEGVDLLTLSACDTAATRADANGREVDGFAELAQRLGANSVMATLWQVSDSSTPWLMRDFYATRQSRKGMTKTESLQKAQLGLLNGKAKIKPLPEAQKSNSANKLKIEIVPNGTKTKRKPTTRGVETFQVEKKNAPKFKKDNRKLFAHPYYWSPFVLYGNWK